MGEDDVLASHMSGVKSYCLVVCGNKLERRRKEKKMKEYNAMNVTLCSKPTDVAMTMFQL